MSEQNGTKRTALGKGISALLGEETGFDQGAGKSPSMKMIDPRLIDPNPQQPRKNFVGAEISELAESIKIDGIIQPLIVCSSQRQGRFTLVAGERRLRASQKLGLDRVPVIFRDTDKEEILRVALIENIQRSDLNIIEEAQAYAALISDFGLTHEQCATKVGKDRVTISNILRILQLPISIQDDLIHGRLSQGHAKVLLSLDSPSQIQKARDIIVNKKLNVRQSEQLCKQLLGKDSPKKGASANHDLDYVAENLRAFLKTKVKVSGNGTRGKIEVSYFSAAELERVVSLIGRESF